MMILIIDNYDSFTYNLYQAVGTLTPSVQVVRNDSLTVSEAAALQPQAIILSPGPGKPKEAGITEAVLEELKGQVPILGVCLGHQAMGEVFGGTVTLAPHLVHGKADDIKLDRSCPLFKNLPQRARKQRPLMKSPAVPKPCEAWQLRSPIRGWKSSRLLEPAGTGPIPSIFQRRQPWFLLQAA